jgi:O-6-methylguanine DNA methyltransferase
MTLFKEKVFSIVRAIPKGEVLTYKQVAHEAGRPRAFRAVGNILNTNYDPKIPCHRVVRSDGKTGGYNRGATRKKEILTKEGAL